MTADFSKTNPRSTPVKSWPWYELDQDPAEGRLIQHGHEHDTATGCHKSKIHVAKAGGHFQQAHVPAQLPAQAAHACELNEALLLTEGRCIAPGMEELTGTGALLVCGTMSDTLEQQNVYVCQRKVHPPAARDAVV